MWEFTDPTKLLDNGDEIRIERIAAASLDQALEYVRRRHYDFTICKAEAMGMMAVLFGSPLD